jgi:hypothetical protein
MTAGGTAVTNSGARELCDRAGVTFVAADERWSPRVRHDAGSSPGASSNGNGTVVVRAEASPVATYVIAPTVTRPPEQRTVWTAVTITGRTSRRRDGTFWARRQPGVEVQRRSCDDAGRNGGGNRTP